MTDIRTAKFIILVGSSDIFNLCPLILGFRRDESDESSSPGQWTQSENTVIIVSCLFYFLFFLLVLYYDTLYVVSWMEHVLASGQYGHAARSRTAEVRAAHKLT